MAELFFQNIVDHRADVVQRATFDNLAAFYQYLDRARRHLERTRYELVWAPLGTVMVVDAPTDVRDEARWRDALRRALEARPRALRWGGGASAEILQAYPDAGIVVVDGAPPAGAKVEVGATARGPGVQAAARVLSAPDEIREALGEVDGVWVELEEPEAEDRDGTVEAFFDEELREVYEVADEPGAREGYTAERRIRVLDQDRERLALLLSRLPRSRRLCVRPNTYVVDCELRAIRALQDQPLPGHRALVRLVENRGHATWPPLPPRTEPLAWQVLTRDARPGTAEQRAFVDRALRTPDFMLLEGPPGSGKTTAIVELILQLAKQRRRVLLCASTHVAVDNVLDRVKDMDRGGNPILAVRVGDEKRVAERLKAYCLHNMVQTELREARRALTRLASPSRAQRHMLDALQDEGGKETLERILLDCAEVVCGTTIGILQHPAIRASTRGGGVWEPVFDTLVLDEASKTPFAEFLVPALLARHWIIVGDRRQLSPYVEESWIETNVEAAIPEGEISREEACRTLVDVFETARSRDGALVVAADSPALRRLYLSQLAGLFPDEPVVHLDDMDAPSPLVLGAARAVIGTRAQIAAVEDALPLSTRILRLPSGELLAVRRRHEARRPTSDEDPWPKALSWRIVRDYELRLLPELIEDKSKDAGKYAADIDLLLPRGGALPRVHDDVERIRRVALPSILESLLARAGVTVLGVSEWLHAKAIVADGERALVMTANLQEHGLDRGFEVGVHLTGADAAALGTILASWQAAARARMRASMRLGDLQGRVQIANGKGYRDVVIEREGTVVDGVTKVDCCTQLARAARPAAAREPSGTRCHRVKHTWSIELPQLAAGAPAVKASREPAPPFPIHEEPGGRRVFAIGEPAEIDAAAAAMSAHSVQAVVLRRER